jgi:hypothetical protein
MMLFSLALNSFVPVDSMAFINEPLQVEGLVLGNVEGYGVGKIGVLIAPSNGWCVKGLDLIGHQKFNAWTTKFNSSLKFGGKLGDEAAEGISKALETELANNALVKEVLEDTQERFTIVIERPDKSNKVVSVHLTDNLHPSKSGEYTIQTYSPAYNPDLNTSIPVPLSDNRLVPDYSKGNKQYMHPLNKVKTVEIEMQGTRNADFAEARRVLQNTIADETGYTWHHLDDFKIINGKPHCTMQLVESTAHQGTGVTGMQHSGSVAQYNAHYGNSTLRPNYP